MQNKISIATTKEIIAWDVKTWAKVLPFWEKNYEITPGLKVLSIGEREGGVSLYFALKGCNVICTDFREFPDSIYEFHKKHEVTGNVSYVNDVDARNLHQFEDGEFDIVVFKSVIGALHEKEYQMKAFDEMYRVLKTDGALLFAENLKGTKLHAFLRNKFINWSSNWRYIDLKEDAEFFQKFRKKHFKTAGFIATFGRSEAQRSGLASIDSCLMWAISKKWRYVLFGVLVK